MITFVYNPIDMMVQAAKNKYPRMEAEIQFNPELKTAGLTTFPEDGSSPLIDINANIPFETAIETLGLELARAATKTQGNDNPAWLDASANIFEEFDRIVGEQLTKYEQNKSR
ncbi:hypothetical protein P8918_12770 [Bacillus spizizenii]|nr:hypothetical protein [Bacillus spizizenii]MCY8890442.1 hypothetical protein [Bacillus spizizenii]MEC0841897.1 hypothetical protein [Bacillus spizizenii]